MVLSWLRHEAEFGAAVLFGTLSSLVSPVWVFIEAEMVEVCFP